MSDRAKIFEDPILNSLVGRVKLEHGEDLLLIGSVGVSPEGIDCWTLKCTDNRDYLWVDHLTLHNMEILRNANGGDGLGFTTEGWHKFFSLIRRSVWEKKSLATLMANGYLRFDPHGTQSFPVDMKRIDEAHEQIAEMSYQFVDRCIKAQKELHTAHSRPAPSIASSQDSGGSRGRSTNEPAKPIQKKRRVEMKRAPIQPTGLQFDDDED